jgi:hypothetical protein
VPLLLRVRLNASDSRRLRIRLLLMRRLKRRHLEQMHSRLLMLLLWLRSKLLTSRR